MGWLSSSREAARIVSDCLIMVSPSLSVAGSVRRAATDKSGKPIAYRSYTMSPSSSSWGVPRREEAGLLGDPRFIDATSLREGGTHQPAVLHYASTLASTRCETHPPVSDIKNFLGELLRIPSMRSSLCSIAPPRTESYVSR